jgi:deoxyribodipyrimidine photolyase-related protein
LLANETLLEPNPGLAMPYRTLARMTDERRRQITTEAQAFLTGASHH